jgi:hypothetical protein
VPVARERVVVFFFQIRFWSLKLLYGGGGSLRRSEASEHKQDRDALKGKGAMDNRERALALALLALALIGACAFIALHYLHRQRGRAAWRRVLPRDSLPAATPFVQVLGSLIVYRLKRGDLREAFYDKEPVDANEKFVMHAMLPRESVVGAERLIFLAHISRSGTTLLCRMLDMHGASTYREPAVLIRLLRSAAARTRGGRSIAVGLVKRVLQHFVHHAQGTSAAIVKLPSAASEPSLLQALNEACPEARRVFVSRAPEEVLGRLESSRGRAGSPSEADRASALAQLRRRHRAATEWASAIVHYEDIVTDARSLKGTCSRLGLAEPSDEEAARMLALKAVDAKTGGLYFEATAPGAS